MALSTVVLIILIICRQKDQNEEETNSLKTDAVSLYQELSTDSSNKKQGYVNNVLNDSENVKLVK